MGTVLPCAHIGLGMVMRCEIKSLVSKVPAKSWLYCGGARYRATRTVRLQTKLGENVERSPIALSRYDIDTLSWSSSVSGSVDGKFNAKDL